MGAYDDEITSTNVAIPSSDDPSELCALISIDGGAKLDASDLSEQPLSFSRDDIAAGTVKTVESGGLVAGAAQSLGNQLELKVNVLGLGLNAKALSTLVGTTVGAAAPVLDGVLESLTGVLGVHLGEADARVNALRCGHARLV